MIHPRLTQREELAQKIMHILVEHVGRQGKGTSWIHACFADNSLDEQSKYTFQVPDFHLEISQKKWGEMRTETIRVNCALDEAEYWSSKSGKLTKGVLIPVVTHLMTGADKMTKILKEHDQYVKDIRGIPVTGIREDQMHHSVGGTTQTSQHNL